MKTLHVGVIGTGFIGKQHIEAIRRIPGTEVVAVADSNFDNAKKCAKALGIRQYYGDYHELLNNIYIDVIHVCTPTAFHFQIAKDAIESGKHVYCEKPLTTTTEEAAELAELAESKNVAAGVNFNYRHNAMVQEMNERVKNGTVGKTLLVHGEYLQDWLLYDTDYDWRLDPKVGGTSRAVADIGSHCFDTAQFILNKKITDVYANLITVYPVRKVCEKTGGTFSGDDAKEKKVINEVPVSSEDAAFIMVKFEDGTPGLFNISQVCAGKKNGLKLTISASKSSLEWKQEEADKLFIGNRDKGNELLYADAKYLTGNAKTYATLPGGHSVAWHDALRNAINSFYTSIKDKNYNQGAQNYATLRDGGYIMKLVDCCVRSSKENRWIHVD